MNESQFWKIIDAAWQQAHARKKADRSASFLDENVKELISGLERLPPDEIIAFDERFSELIQSANRTDVKGAAYWLGGGCSQGGFWNFRSLLVSLGRERFERILENPDSLAEMEQEPDF